MFEVGMYFFLFFFNDTATTEIYTLSLHDALPIFSAVSVISRSLSKLQFRNFSQGFARSEEHTSELQSLAYLVCRLLLAKTNNLSGETDVRQRRLDGTELVIAPRPS